MARRPKKSYLNLFLLILIIGILTILIIKINQDNKPSSDNKEDKTNQVEKSDINKKDDKKSETAPSKTDNKASSNEKTENKNENQRRGGNVTIELIGDDEITIGVGSDYKDAGFNATYDDGEDASNEVEVENTVDTSVAGIYTVTYYYGNTVAIRRVTVE